MKCKYHSGQEARAICEKCKNPVCEECTVNVSGRTVCHHCIEQNLITPLGASFKRPWLERFLFFICSLIPGAAHMYLGLFRRGLQFMFVAFGVLALSAYINLAEFFIPMVVIPIWFLSFFESHNFKQQWWKGQELSDQDLFDRNVFDYTPLLKNRRMIGIVVIVIGVFALMHSLESGHAFGWLYKNYFFANLYYSVKISLIPVFLILSGIYLLLKSKQTPKSNEDAA